MLPFDLTLRNALVVTEDLIHHPDVGVRDGRIAAIESGLEPGIEDVDASGLLLLPGGVDSHVHVDQEFSSGRRSRMTSTRAAPPRWPAGRRR